MREGGAPGRSFIHVDDAVWGVILGSDESLVKFLEGLYSESRPSIQGLYILGRSMSRWNSHGEVTSLHESSNPPRAGLEVGSLGLVLVLV